MLYSDEVATHVYLSQKIIEKRFVLINNENICQLIKKIVILWLLMYILQYLSIFSIRKHDIISKVTHKLILN